MFVDSIFRTKLVIEIFYFVEQLIRGFVINWLIVNWLIIAGGFRLCLGVGKPVDYIDKIISGLFRSLLGKLQRGIFIQLVVKRVNSNLLGLKHTGDTLGLSLVFSRHVIKGSRARADTGCHETEHADTYRIRVQKCGLYRVNCAYNGLRSLRSIRYDIDPAISEYCQFRSDFHAIRLRRCIIQKLPDIVAVR